MKYPTSDYHLRRFQIRFPNKHHCAEAISILRRAGIPLQAPQQRSTAMPGSNPSPLGPHAIGRNSQLLDGSTYASQIRISPQPPGLSQTLIASQDLKVPAFQGRPQASAATLSDSLSYRGRSTTNDVLFDNDFARRSGITSSSAPVPVIEVAANRIKKQQFVTSTMPISFPVYSDTELPPPRKLPFATERVKTEENVNRVAVPVIVSQKSPEIANESTNVSPSQPSMMVERPHAGTSGTFQGRSAETAAQPSLTADDIDTQTLLTQVAKRASRSRNAKSNLDKVSSQIADASRVALPASQKIKSTTCQSCKSAHRRCIKDSKTPGGSCLPCSKAGKVCSLVSTHEIPVESGAISLTKFNVQPVIPVRNCGPRQPPVGISSHRGEPMDDIEISMTTPQLENSGNQFGSQTGWKRRSQDTMPPPPSKRLKEQSRKIYEEETFDIVSNNKTCESDRRSNMSLPQIRKPLSLRKTTNRSSSVQLRSDATTATADTDDLNRIPTRRALPYQRKRVQLSSDRPAFSEISELAEVQLEIPKATSIQHDTEIEITNNIPKDEASSRDKLFAQPQGLNPANMTFSEFFGLGREGQDTTMREFVYQAIMDDNFIEVCKRLQGLPGFSVLNGKI